MDLSMDLKKQLMDMAGITDVNEFDQMVSKMSNTTDAGQGKKAASKKQNQSPFQVHFVKMLALLDLNGRADFDALNNDASKQIQYVFDVINNDGDYCDITAFMDKYHFQQDSSLAKITDKDRAETSVKMRDRGNQAYAKKELEKALMYFSQSALMGPIQNRKGREVAIALANRSAVHFEMEQWYRSLIDIKAAFMFGYPEELQFKLFDRQGRCLVNLGGCRVEAIDCFSKALEKVHHSKLDNKKREKMIQDIQNKLDEVKASIDQSKGREQSLFDESQALEEIWPKCPFEIWDRNPAFPPLSDALAIAFDQEGGRHIMAKRNIIAGEPIVIEEPVSAHLSPCFMVSNCIHCLRRTGTSVLPSPLNPKARFCCLKCLEEAMESYHVVESAVDINQLFYDASSETGQMSGCISLAYRAITQRPLSFFLNHRESLFAVHDIKFGIDMPQTFKYTGDEHYRGLYNLVNHQAVMTSDERQAFMVRTVVLLKCLKAAGYFGQENGITRKLTSEELYIGKLLFHFQTGIQYNLHAVYQVSEKELEPGKRIPLKDIGAGCYPTTIFFNHSCSPNTVRINQGKRVVYVAKRNIASGDQVTDCYGIHHLYMDTKTRQEALQRGYAFTCTCDACRLNYGTLAQLKAVLSPNDALKLGNTMSKYKELFLEGKVEKALKCCQDYLGKLELLEISYPHRNYELAAIALCSCLWAVATRKNGSTSS